MKGVFSSFLATAFAVFIVCIIMMVVTGNLLPFILLTGTVWALYFVAVGLAGGK